MAGKGSAWELASLSCLFHCYSVMNIPDGVYPEKYNYTYSPCRPVVCNSTTGETAAVSGWSCNATVKQYGLYRGTCTSQWQTCSLFNSLFPTVVVFQTIIDVGHQSIEHCYLMQGYCSAKWTSVLNTIL